METTTEGKTEKSYRVGLIYYGPANLSRSPQVKTQNIRIVAFPHDSNGSDWVAIYELVRVE